MAEIQGIQIRVATIDDFDFIAGLLPRLSEFGLPAWRDAASMLQTDVAVIQNKLSNQPEGTKIFIAGVNNETPLGFLHIQSGSDYYNNEPHAHISDLIVDTKAAGKGVGLLLLNHAESWARAQGYRWLTLSVFAQNTRARDLYTRLGYGEDIMKYVKQI